MTMPSPRVRAIIDLLDEMNDEERNELRRELETAARHATIAERIARVQGSPVKTLTVDEVERSIRKELDF